jgi:ribosomal-protein-alanine N-acetyltransferase
MRIREYRPSDLPTLSKIDQACFPPGVCYSQEELADFIAHPSSRTWVAEVDGLIAGFVVASCEPSGIGHIITIDVLEEQRRRGIGTALMNTVEEWAREARMRLIYLETAEDNRAAHRFYEERGYRKIEKIERYYNNGQAAWVMVKRLS